MASDETRDIRAIQLDTEIETLLNAAQGIWRDALESQLAISQKTAALHESITEIKSLSSLLTYPAGTKKIQQIITRLQSVRRRINTVNGRLNRISATLERQKTTQ